MLFFIVFCYTKKSPITNDKTFLIGAENMLKLGRCDNCFCYSKSSQKPLLSKIEKQKNNSTNNN